MAVAVATVSRALSLIFQCTDNLTSLAAEHCEVLEDAAGFPVEILYATQIMCKNSKLNTYRQVVSVFNVELA